jgi:hypothetical protein
MSEPKLKAKIVDGARYAVMYLNAPNIVLPLNHDAAQMFKSELTDAGAKKQLKEFFSKMVDEMEIERESL